MQKAQSADQVIAALTTVAAMARSYTRGVGWVDDEPADDIDAVIVAATCHLLTNVGQLDIIEGMGAFTVQLSGAFASWSLTERACLDRYRVKAQ